MDANEVMDQIKQEMTNNQGTTTNQQVNPNQIYICCPNCGRVSTWNKNIPIPSKCSGCGNEGVFGAGKTEMEAKDRAGQLARGEPVKPEPVKPEPVKPEPIKPEPVKQEPVKQEPVKQEPKTRRAAAKKKEPEPIEQVTDNSEQANEPGSGEELVGNDRQAGMLALINSKGLNTIQFKPVCKATVYSLGFTEWKQVDGEDGTQKRVPVVTVKEPTDDAASFRQLLTDARRKDGRVCIDVARLTGFPANIGAALFNFTLDASTFSPSGPLPVKIGDVVEVGAKISQSGKGLIWSVLKVV